MAVVVVVGRGALTATCAQPVCPRQALAAQSPSEGDGDLLVNMLLLLNIPLLLLGSAVVVEAADLVIRIPGDLSQQDGFYRLDYRCSGWRGRAGGEGVLRVAPPT